MTPRETLVELLMQGMEKAQKQNIGAFLAGSLANILADYLIENKAIVPPCKVGDTVYRTFDGVKMVESVIEDFAYDAKNGFVFRGHDVEDGCHFVTRRIVTKEEAEKALAEKRADNG